MKKKKNKKKKKNTKNKTNKQKKKTKKKKHLGRVLRPLLFRSRLVPTIVATILER